MMTTGYVNRMMYAAADTLERRNYRRTIRRNNPHARPDPVMRDLYNHIGRTHLNWEMYRQYAEDVLTEYPEEWLKNSFYDQTVGERRRYEVQVDSKGRRIAIYRPRTSQGGYVSLKDWLANY